MVELAVRMGPGGAGWLGGRLSWPAGKRQEDAKEEEQEERSAGSSCCAYKSVGYVGMQVCACSKLWLPARAGGPSKDPRKLPRPTARNLEPRGALEQVNARTRCW